MNFANQLCWLYNIRTMSFSVPERCASCPWLKLEHEQLEKHGHEQDNIIRKATSDKLDEVAELVAARLQQAPQDLIETHGTPPDAESIAKMMRAIGSEALGNVSRQMEKIEHDIEMMSTWCKGPVELSTTRDGVVYSIGVCASLFLLEEDTGGYEFTTVRRYEVID